MMRHVSLREIESNPWLPDVALGEVRDALEGTVEEWLTRGFADPADLVMPAELVRLLSDKGHTTALTVLTTTKCTTALIFSERRWDWWTT